MKIWTNILGYQSMWLAAVWGAGHGLWWPGVAAAAPFVAWMLARRGARTDLVLMAGVVPLGCAMDSVLAVTGLVAYGAAVPSPHLAPLWIAAIWCCFALTLRHAFRFLLGRPLLAALFGALGAPLAYLGAAHGWNAVAFGHGAVPAMIALAAMWAFAMPLVMHLARLVERRAGVARTGGHVHA